jgi:3-phosphoshikimate 1-carboxyvinyltransferase
MHVLGEADGGWAAPLAITAVRASVPLPGSKSITNRALILAALAEEPTKIVGPLQARDTELMAAAVRSLGAAIDRLAPAAGLAGAETGDLARPLPTATATPSGQPTWIVTPGWTSGAATVNVGNAGTVLRFVPPAAALAAADVQFVGDPRASQRPVGQLLSGLRQVGVEIDDGGSGAVPFMVRGRGRVPGGTVRLDASSSSQLVSGLMLAAPRYERGAQIIHLGPRVPSAPHIAMTVAMLAAAGAEVEAISSGRGGGQVADSWRILPGRLAPGTVTIEPDLANAAPFLAAALVTGGRVTIPGWPAESLQASDQILDVLGQMGASCTPTAAGMQVAGTGRITGIKADLRDVNELAPVLTALAALADSPSEFTGIGHMRLQESDRLAALAGEIGTLGGQVTELADGLRVEPRPLRAGAEPFDSHDDHRLVMAAAVLGLAVPGLRVGNAATVGKTFPEFTAAWRQMLEPAP